MRPLRPIRPLLHAGFALALGTCARASEPIDFSRQILPILSDACFHCHAPDGESRSAKLRLDQREGLFRTRKDVTVVAPANRTPANSSNASPAATTTK